jgi:diguanylate cyclase (GGDEF)-like protein
MPSRQTDLVPPEWSRLEGLAEAWNWRELDAARCRELLDAAAGPTDAVVFTPHQSAEFGAAPLVVWGYLCFREARQAEALECAGEALALLADQAGSFWYSRALNVRSCALLELAELEQAGLSLREQLRASRTNGDTETEGSGLHDLGVMHTQRDPAHAEGYLLAALEVFERTRHPVGRSFVTWSLAELRECQGRRAEARPLYRSALTLARACGHRFLEVLVLSRLGELELQYGDAQAGEQWLREALDRQSADLSRPLWITIPPLVRLLLHSGRMEEARGVLEAQLHGARAAGMATTQMSIHELLSEVYEALADAPQALKHARDHLRLFRQRNTEEQAQKVRGLEVLHRTELAQQEAQAQRQSNRELRAALAELERLHRQLGQVSVTDELTGVYNRHYLMSRGVQLLTSGERPVDTAVAILDIDHFKAVNDTYGHDGGDRVLRAFAQYLRAGLRERDVLTRFGGEEFVVIFPETPLGEAYTLLDTLRFGLRDHLFPDMPADFSLAYTAGLVGCPDGDLLGALRRADQLLYRGKRSGRNAVSREYLEGRTSRQA